MGRPKGSKNRKTVASSTASGKGSAAKILTVEITEDLILRNFSAQELMRMAASMLSRSESDSHAIAPARPAAATRRGRRRFSAEARAKMAEAQKKRWAKARKKK